MVKRRVVITGIGVISPNGIGKKNAWAGFSSGKSGVRLVDGFDVSVFNTKIASEVRDFDPFKLGLTHKEAIRMDRYVQFGVAAGKMAIEDSKLNFSKEELRAKLNLPLDKKIIMYEEEYREKFIKGLKKNAPAAKNERTAMPKR